MMEPWAALLEEVRDRRGLRGGLDQLDALGLRTADEAGKNHFESFMGEHIRIPDAQLYSLISKYFK